MSARSSASSSSAAAPPPPVRGPPAPKRGRIAPPSAPRRSPVVNVVLDGLSSPKLENAAGAVHVQIIEARYLPPAKILASTNYYAVIKFQNNRVETHTIRNNSSPKWNIPFHFSLSSLYQDEELELEVWDKNSVKRPTLIGSARVNLSAISTQLKPVMNTVSLRNANGKIKGELQLQIFVDGVMAVDRKDIPPPPLLAPPAPKNVPLLSEPISSLALHPLPSSTVSTSATHSSISVPPPSNLVVVKSPVNASASPTPEENERLFQEYLRNNSCCVICSGHFAPESIFQLDCSHNYCDACLNRSLKKQLDSIVSGSHKSMQFKCTYSGCGTVVADRLLKEILSAEDFTKYDQLLLEKFVEGDERLFHCPNPACKLVMEKLSSDSTQTSSLKGPDDKPLSPEALDCYKNSRFRCPNCSTIFCASCKAQPFHLGFTCQEYKSYLESRHCRFCGVQLAASVASGPVKDVCTQEECQERAAMCCTRVLKCGHPCNGIKNERACLPCLRDSCCSASSAQKGSDFCNICWAEALESAPCIQLICGHVFHNSCIRKKLTQRWPSARITFGFSECPLCKHTMEHPSLVDILAPIKQLKAEVESKATQRLSYEGLINTRDLKDPKSRFFGKPTEYAMDRFSYFLCSRCKHPYFAGQKQCDAGNEEKEYNPADLVCGGCSGGANAATCKKHGAEFIEYKCQFCCSVAVWFCWGTTHFCDDCHTKQNKGAYLTKMPATYFAKCPGPESCPLKVAHPHVAEFVLGCSLCRNIQSF